MRSATIASGASLSHAVDLGDGKFNGISIPAGWAEAATAITFQVSADGTTWQNLYDDEGHETSATVAASRNIGLSSIALDLAPWRWIKIRSGTAASAVNQAGNSSAKYEFDFGSSKTLTVTSGVAGAPSNEIVVEFVNAEDDNLAVSKVDSLKKIIVALANTTGSKNADSAIETAVQALSTVGLGDAAIDVSAMTVAGSTQYDAAPVARSAAAKVFSFSGDKTLTFTSGVKGPAGNVISVTLETAANDTLAVTNPENTYDILVKLANATGSKNADSAIQTAVQTLSAIGPTGETLDVSGMTVVGNAAYDAAPLAPVYASKTITVDTGKTLTFASGVWGPASNGIKVSIGVNESDALAVTAADGVISILLASETASSNAAAAIQAAIRAIEGGKVADISVAAFSVTGNAGYNAAPVIALGDGISVEEVPLEGGAIVLESGVYEGVFLEGGAEAIEPVSANLAGGADIELVLAIKD